MKTIEQQIKEKDELIQRLLKTCITNDMRRKLTFQKELLEELMKGEQCQRHYTEK